MALEQSGRAGVALERLAAELHGELRIDAVAGVGEGAVEVHRPVGVRAGDRIAADFDAPGAGEAALEDVGQLLDGGGGRDDLEHGAGRECRGEDAVHVHAVIAAVAVGDRGRIGGVEVGGGDHAENLPGLVVIDRDGALPPV